MESYIRFNGISDGYLLGESYDAKEMLTTHWKVSFDGTEILKTNRRTISWILSSFEEMPPKLVTIFETKLETTNPFI